MNGRIEQCDSLVFMKKQDNCSADIIYCDPPYALGSEIIIRKDGKPDYKKAVDFMNKWEQPDGRFWEEWFKEAFRALKYGGRVIMFGMDRQLMLNKYYACNAGFEEQQSLYWYFISNFPKATDLSKMIDRNLGVERTETGETKIHAQKGVAIAEERGTIGGGAFGEAREEKITSPTSELAKKYEGYKYSISPLKQTNETIMVFQKPYNTGSCLHDVKAYENGDGECLCGALNIDGNRVGFASSEDEAESKNKNQHEDFGTMPMTGNNVYGDFSMIEQKNYNPPGRYPAQTFIDSEAAKILDRQSGILKGSGDKNRDNEDFENQNVNAAQITTKREGIWIGYKDTGGCSKILHKCEFDEEEHDIYFYCPKVSKAERNGGLDEFEEKTRADINKMMGEPGNFKTGSGNDRTTKMKNNHPTLKPIALNKRILSLFKTPNEQKILYPFAGTFSEVIGGYLAGFTNYAGCELGENWIEIGEARFKYWIEKEEKNIEDQFNLFTETEAA